ncbi:MAG TPA: DoxX family protein [bacterium]|nr:DoxX family protein [bacterium]HNO12541.1 DoxX family protein [bacterium]
MSSFQDRIQNIESRMDLAYALVRIYLGVALAVRGILFLKDPSMITTMAGVQQFYMWYAYIIGSHILGGVFLALGIMTRTGALLQIPVVAGAIIFFHLGEGLMTAGQSLELAALVFFLLVVCLIFGSGNWSLEKFFSGKRATA